MTEPALTAARRRVSRFDVFRWVEHTSELELEIEAPAEEDIYGEALRAMAELLSEDADTETGALDGAPATGGDLVHDVALQAADRSRLLAAFLGELAFLAETERFVPARVERLTAGPQSLRATLRGRTGDPAHLVKAVTYHRLSFDAVGNGWRATAVLDV